MHEEVTVNRSQPWGMLAEQSRLMVSRGQGAAGLTAWLDFSEPVVLKRSEPERGMRELFNQKATTGLPVQIGFFGYDYLCAHLGFKTQASVDIAVPDGLFARPATRVDFLGDNTVVSSVLPGRAQALAAQACDLPAAEAVASSEEDAQCNLSFDQYQRIFKSAREAVLDGETYQIKISQRFEKKARIHPLHAFLKLRQINPSPEAFLLQWDDFSLVSCSPEMVIERHGDQLLTKPIGGTWRKDDGGSLASFTQDEKELSEHNMIVDLERNDLSQVCEPATVCVRDYRMVETYAHLHHLVTLIEGRLKKGVSTPDILRAMLPGGSVTGCPKWRTLELIDRLEPCARGPYTGSFGLLHDDGTLALNLIIRTIVGVGERCYAQAGGGIVADSTAEYEYRENLTKARALLDLLEGGASA